jgi:hypothetical protein
MIQIMAGGICSTVHRIASTIHGVDEAAPQGDLRELRLEETSADHATKVVPHIPQGIMVIEFMFYCVKITELFPEGEIRLE